LKNKKLSKRYLPDQASKKIRAANHPSRLQRIVKKTPLAEGTDQADLDYWLSLPPSKRVEAVELLRKNHYGSSVRLQRTVRVAKLARRMANKRKTARKKDLADLKALGED
jgi:hypothetical protein